MAAGEWNMWYNAVCAGAVLGTGDPGSRPGRHFFIRRGGRQEHLKKKIIWAAKRFSIIYHITVCGIGKLAPPAAAGASARQEGAVERSCVRRGKGRGRGGQFTSPKWNGQGGAGDPLYSSHISTFFPITHIHNTLITVL